MHGGIDGFSRRLLWLKMGPTNCKPEVTTKFYVDAAKRIGGLPRKVRSHNGTENSMAAAVHTCLWAFLTGRFTAKKKRIEAYWSWVVD